MVSLLSIEEIGVETMLKHDGHGRRWTAAQLIAEIRRIAQVEGTSTLRLETFYRRTGISKKTIQRHFEDWPTALRLAGLKSVRQRRKADVSDEALFENIRNIHQSKGHTPSMDDMR